MKKSLLILIVTSLVMFANTNLFAQSEVCGPITLELYDSYGDGWNGNTLEVDDGNGKTSYTLTSGSIGSFSLTLGYQDTLSFIWQN